MLYIARLFGRCLKIPRLVHFWSSTPAPPAPFSPWHGAVIGPMPPHHLSLLAPKPTLEKGRQAGRWADNSKANPHCTRSVLLIGFINYAWPPQEKQTTLCTNGGLICLCMI